MDWGLRENFGSWAEAMRTCCGRVGPRNCFISSAQKEGSVKVFSTQVDLIEVIGLLSFSPAVPTAVMKRVSTGLREVRMYALRAAKRSACVDRQCK